MKVPLLLLLLLLLFVSFFTLVSSSQGKQLMRKTKSAQGPSATSAFAPPYREPTLAPHHRHKFRHHHRHRLRPYAAAPTLDAVTGCDQTCVDPFTATPIGTPCGCVIPMNVRILLSIAVYALFPEVNELEKEISMGTYLEQSQVQIVGATSDSQNQERTVVDVNLVPLRERFDNTTAILTYERLWRKEVPLNRTLFGNYDVVYVNYPGVPLQFPPEDNIGSGPAGCVGGQQYPITADLINKNKKMDSKVLFVIVFSAFVLFVASIALIIVLIKWKKVRKPSNAVGPVYTPSTNKKNGTASTLSGSVASSTSMSLLASMPTCALPVRTFSLSELEKATDRFSSRRILGEGGFGRVYHGILEDGIEVAVKLLTRDHQNGYREFISEVEMLSRLHHRNLVKLIGICIQGRRRCLVYELVHNGSVESHLHGADRRKGHLDWDARLKIALGAARGLAYLHEDSNPRVIHRDFKASNVLLEDDYTPKVSDFGLAREATEGSQHVSTRVMGTFGYVAPEYAMTGHLLVKSDVYSYGVVLLELLTGRKPVDMSQPPGQENLVTWARPLLTSREGVEQLVDPALAGNYNFDDLAKVAAIASMCVHPEVTHRPFMGEVVQALKLIYNDSDETCEDCGSLKDSSIPDFDGKSDIGPSDNSWWNRQSLPFVTMEYSSGSLEEMENRKLSTFSFIGERGVLPPLTHENRSGPLRLVRNKSFFHRLTGSMSEHASFLSRRARSDGF